MADDYRNTKYCPTLENIQIKKDEIVKKIKKEHIKAIDMHTYISDNKDNYKKEFIKVYNGKCSYCGVSLDLIAKSSFQVDHFIFRKSPEFKGSKAAAGSIDNLVLSCDICNHNKSSFSIPKDEREILHPDKKISTTFYRDENYYIKVAKDFDFNVIVNDFYKALQLGTEIHRLDYLLMNMIGLQKQLTSEHPAYKDLGQAIELLKRKRNIMA